MVDTRFESHPVTPAGGLFDRLASPTAIVVFWISYGVVFAAIQVFSSSTLNLDEAVTAETVQRQFSLAYQIRNPPLFDWLYYLIQRALGDGIVSHALLRYSIVATIGILHYPAFRQVGCSRRVAAALSYSLVFFVWMAVDIHTHFTHSLPLFAVGLAAWVCAIAYIARPVARLAVLLGFLIGLGLISKWSFPLPLAGATLAFALDKRARAAFAHWHSLLIPVAALVPIAPVGYWLMTVDANLIFFMHDVMVTEPVPYLERIGPAIWSYLESIVLYLLPWPIFIGLIFYRTRQASIGTRSENANGRLAASATLWTIGVGLAGVAAIGVDNMGMRYMFPVLLFAPVAIAAWLAPRVNDENFAGLTITAALIVTLVAAIVRLWSFNIVDGVLPKNTRQRLPYEALAHELTMRGLGSAQFVTSSARDAGNLMAQLPDARAISLNSVRVEPPRPDPVSERLCVFLWDGGDWKVPGEPRPMRIPHVFAPAITATDRQVKEVIVDWPALLYGNPRRSIWWYAVVAPQTPACLVARGFSTSQ